MTTIVHRPETASGYRASRTGPATDRQPTTAPPEQRTTAWRQRIPGPQLPGFVSGVTLLVGLWLLLAPAVWNYGGTGGGLDARWNDLLVGLLITAVGVSRLAGRIRLAPAGLIAGLAGLWLIAAPFALAYGFGTDSTRATANDMLIGLLIVTVTAAGHISARMTLQT